MIDGDLKRLNAIDANGKTFFQAVRVANGIFPMLTGLFSFLFALLSWICPFTTRQTASPYEWVPESHWDPKARENPYTTTTESRY
jgi:hypothetical protein